MHGQGTTLFPSALLHGNELGPVELRGGGNMDAVRHTPASSGPAAIVLLVRRRLVPSLPVAMDIRDAVAIILGREGNAAGTILQLLERGTA